MSYVICITNDMESAVIIDASIYIITWKYAYDTTVAEDPKFLILLNFDMILGLITHPISLTNCIGVLFPS